MSLMDGGFLVGEEWPGWLSVVRRAWRSARRGGMSCAGRTGPSAGRGPG
ncbi:Uncharacterised protein [Bordetella pertussis]|nr:Uncharacterised protein [Bordetella pertussis]